MYKDSHPCLVGPGTGGQGIFDVCLASAAAANWSWDGAVWAACDCCVPRIGLLWLVWSPNVGRWKHSVHRGNRSRAPMAGAANCSVPSFRRRHWRRPIPVPVSHHECPGLPRTTPAYGEIRRTRGHFRVHLMILEVAMGGTRV